jgi:hypothetical protein
MKMIDIVSEGIYDTDPKLEPFVKMGRKITAALDAESGVNWPDDDVWNKAASLGSALTSLGTAFGVDSASEAIRKAGLSVEEAKEIFAMVKDFEPPRPADNDAGDDADDSEDDFDDDEKEVPVLDRS